MSDKQAFQDLRDRLMQLYEDGQHASGLELLEQASDSFPDRRALLVFWRMCLLSLCDRPDELLALFQQSLGSGLWWAASQFEDRDLDAVRDLPEFKRLVGISDAMAQQVRAQMIPTRSVLVPDEAASPWPVLIALHGRGSDKDDRLHSWQPACERGWLVVSPESAQPNLPGSYCWDDPAEGVKDIVLHAHEVAHSYNVEHDRLIFGGFSQGAGMALCAALSGKLNASGFIGVGTYWDSLKELEALAAEARNLRAYFVVGGQDRTLGRTREIEALLKQAGIPCAEELHPDVGHEFPAGFGASFDHALQFIRTGQTEG